jgi:hypothetical protein
MKKINLNKIKDKKREITLVLIILMVFILFFTGYSFGKGSSKIDVEADGKIAEPILIVENNEPVSLSNTNTSGYYDFIVKNYNEEEKVTDIKLEYYVEILGTANESITYKLYKNDEEVELQNQKTNNFTLTNMEKQEDKYRLEVRL